jgi:hypothetical protein
MVWELGFGACTVLHEHTSESLLEEECHILRRERDTALVGVGFAGHADSES